MARAAALLQRSEVRLDSKSHAGIFGCIKAHWWPVVIGCFTCMASIALNGICVSSEIAQITQWFIFGSVDLI